MPAPVFTPTTDAEAIPTIIAQEVIRQLPSFMGITRFVSKDVDWTGSDFASYGDTLNIVNPGSLTVKTKTPGSQYESQAPTADKIQVELNRQKYIDLTDDDFTKMLRKPDLQAAYAEKMAIELAEEIEGFLFSLHSGIGNTVTFNASSATTIDATMRALRSRFARNKVPYGEKKMLFAETSVIDALLSVERYSSRDFVPDAQAVQEGVVRRIYGVDVMETQLVAQSGSPVAYHNIATGKLGFVVVNRPLPVTNPGRGVIQTNLQDPFTGLTFRLTEGYDNNYGGERMRLEVVYGAALCDEKYVVEVESF